MCGILGIVSLNKQLEVNKNLFSNCLELMNHRGPDHSGIFFNNKTIFSTSDFSPLITHCPGQLSFDI